MQPMYAVVRTGGKQYRVEPGAIVEVERLPVEEGAVVDLDEVLFVSDGGSHMIGTPTVAGAKVVAEVLEHGRHAKITVQKYKPKVRYLRRRGHRQPLTRLAIREIVTAKPSRKAQKAEAPE